MSVFRHPFWHTILDDLLSLPLSLPGPANAYTKIDTLPGSLPEFSLCGTHRDPRTSQIVLIASKFVRCEITNNEISNTRESKENLVEIQCTNSYTRYLELPNVTTRATHANYTCCLGNFMMDAGALTFGKLPILRWTRTLSRHRTFFTFFRMLFKFIPQ